MRDAQENAPQGDHPRLQTLNVKVHRALSKLAHTEADRAAAKQASIEQGRSDMALALWAEGRRAPSGRPPLGHQMRLGDTGDREAATGGDRRRPEDGTASGEEEGAEVEADRGTGLPSHRRPAVLEQEEGES
jgi:hypothetical protein